jgi:hypothetical protein
MVSSNISLFSKEITKNTTLKNEAISAQRGFAFFVVQFL